MHNLLIHFSHHKCGTRWITSICREVANHTGRLTDNFTNLEYFNLNISKYRQKKSLLSYSNAKSSSVDKLNSFRGFHVIRDPRDLLVSSYFSSLKTHSTEHWPQLNEHREQLNKCSIEQGLLLEMAFISDAFKDLNEWNYSDERILEIKMEDLMFNNYKYFINIATHLGLLDENDQSNASLYIQTKNQCRLIRNRVLGDYLKLSWLTHYPDKIPTLNYLGIIHRNRFEEKAKGRYPGLEDKNSHYRKGISGDWRNHFNPEIKNRFKETYGDLVIKLGYETDFNW